MSNPAAANPAESADHVIVINYEGDKLGPDPATKKVAVGKSIRFVEGQMPAGHTMQITFKHPQHFSAARFRKGNAPVMVKGAFPEGQGRYLCDLVLDGKVVPSRIPGGSLELDTGDGVTR